ncbi:homologous-pairing protein-like protein 2 [Sphaerosporella brunnea]|uniref:Homologous-pairing protein-like protein 2 n=1 Tax=Sphaerosporella brunnea TaxID=1250544 RepID=A0A5J5F930_9PEZI|nr:homologous-pairing protein-like protein 2 [Sphaerosporella brunnea]
MPPKKEKKEQFTGDQASDMILEYLMKQNRPYSATDISSNLHNAVTKATAARILKEMHESALIEGRISGKQIVYHAIQACNAGEKASEENLKTMDAEIESIKMETASMKAKIKETQATLSTLRSTPTVIALTLSIEEKEGELVVLNDTLKTLHANNTCVPVDPTRRAAAEQDYSRIEKVFLHRRRQFKELWGIIADGYPGDLAQLWEGIGLDGEMP